MITPADARRRWFGALFLIIGFSLLIWGTTLLNDYLVKRPILFVFFWGTCALFTGMAMINAMVDMSIMRRRTREEKIALAQRSFGDLEEQKKKRG